VWLRGATLAELLLPEALLPALGCWPLPWAQRQPQEPAQRRLLKQQPWMERAARASAQVAPPEHRLARVQQ